MLWAAIAVMASALTAQAQITGPCADTITKCCSDVIPGEGRLVKCLNDHRDAQSIACKDWIAEQQKSLRELNTARYEELSKLCGAGNPDSIRIFQCLNLNYVALKLDCREKIREIKDRLQ